MTLKEFPARLASVDEAFDEAVERCLERYCSRLSPVGRVFLALGLVVVAVCELLLLVGLASS